MKRTILLVLVLVLVPCLAAVQDLSITSKVDLPVCHERIVLELRNDLNSSLNSALFSVPSDASKVRVEDEYGRLPFTTEEFEGVVKLTYDFQVPVKPGEERLVIVEYDTREVLRRKGRGWEFLMVFQPTSNYNIEHTLELPEEYVLMASKDSVISPQAEVEAVGGKTRVKWNMTADDEDSTVFIARFSSQNTINWLLLGSGLLLLSLIIVLGFLLSKGMKKYAKMRKLKAVKLVKDENREILELVINNPGIEQKEIQEELDVSKSSVSKRVTNLEGQGLLEKRKRGRKNYLYPGPKLA